MKRDMDLIRKILFSIEGQGNGRSIDELKIEGYTEKEIVFHSKILYDGGYLLDFIERYADNDYLIYYSVGCLSWSGCEFLDEIRSETVWNKTKETINNKGLPMVLDVIKNVASAIITGMTQAAIKAL